MEKINLVDFRNLSDIEKVDLVNNFAAGKKDLKDVTNEFFNFTNIGRYMPQNVKWSKLEKKYNFVEDKKGEENMETNFTGEEILQLKKIIAFFNKPAESPKSELITRSVRVHGQEFNIFADWCREKNIKQSDAIFYALEEYMQKNL